MDQEKINALLMQWITKLREMDSHRFAVQQLQQEIIGIQMEVEAEEAKTK